MEQLTARQQEVLGFIQQFMTENGFPPTRMEIAGALGFSSPNASEDHLKALSRKGAIELLSGSSRGIRVLQRGRGKGLPLVGQVAAGNPILARENIEDRYRVDAQLFAPKADYLLRVKGHSMRDAGILNGDLLAVHRTTVAESGDIVVARLDDEVTVKRFRRRGNIVRLMPENPDFDPIVVDIRKQELDIDGIGVGVIRNQLR